MKPDDDKFMTETADGVEAPVFVLPGAGATTAQGIGSGSGTSTGSPIIPQPFLADIENGRHHGTDSLADRIEELIAEDGRFSALLDQLNITADDQNGQVTVTGSAPAGDQYRSLIAMLHAVPGVTAVTDQTR